MANRSIDGAIQSAAQDSGFEEHHVVLSVGELGLVLRSLRYYIHGEQRAASDALILARATKHQKDLLHAEDVKRQSDSHIAAANALHTKLSRSTK